MISRLGYLLHLLPLAAAGSVQAFFSSNGGFESPPRSSPQHESCPADSPLSCRGSGGDSCCYEATNGVLMATQFWDYSPATGRDDVFTIHGLWVDKCGGGYNQNCNPSWNIDNATQILKSFGLDDLLTTMQDNWKDIRGNDENLWVHEFNKHGTCMATLNPSCYERTARANQNVVDFFQTAVDLWLELPTYQFLTSAGIFPSESATFTVQQFQDAISPNIGRQAVYLGCDDHNALYQVYYYFNVKGSVATGTFSPIGPENSRQGCKDGFRWLPKGSKHGGGGGGGDGTSGYLKLSGQPGCLISNGKWFTSGTCATFRTKTTTFGTTVTSSKGNCGIVKGVFTCGKGITAGEFALDSDNNLSYGGNLDWSADHIPGHQEQVSVFANGESTVKFSLVLS